MNSNVENISSYLDDYIKFDNPQYAVMLNGEWGCGKTFFIKRKIEEWSLTPIDSKKVQETEVITLTPIYVSLNGLKSIKQIIYLLKKELNPILYSRGAKIAKQILIGSINAVLKTSFDLNKDGKTDDLSSCLQVSDILDILFKSNDQIQGNKILIFDDLERCQMPLLELFGFINDLVEHSNCRVILLCNEKELFNDDEEFPKSEYEKIKEKVIGHTLLFKQDTSKVIDVLIQDVDNEVLKQNISIIKNIISASTSHNFRVIKRCFFDLSKLLNEINKENFDKKGYLEFVKNLIFYFLVIYIEYKSGNTFVENLYDLKIGLEEDLNNKISQLERKYLPVQKFFELKRVDDILSVKSIVKYINDGYISDLNDILTSNKILNQDKTADWEDLYFYNKLENVSFSSKLDSLQKTFFHGEINSVPIILHTYGLLLNFTQLQLVSLDRKGLKDAALEQIDNVYKNINNITDEKIFVQFHGASYGKAYYMRKDSDMDGMIKYAEKRRTDYYDMMLKKYCSKFWEELSNETINDIYKYFEQTTPNKVTKCSYVSIFDGADVNQLSSNILNLSNKNRRNFTDYLFYRYQIDYDKGRFINQTYFKDDFPVLHACKEQLKIEVNNLTLIDKISVQELISVLNFLDSHQSTTNP